MLFDGTATHEHDGTSWQQIPTPAQPPSTPMDAMAFHAATGQSLLCNGQTWIWDGANWTRLQPAAQPPPVNALAYDSRRAQIVALVFSGSPPVSSTWIWDGVSWTQPSAPGPTASPSAFNWWSVRMSYDENRDRTVAAWSRSLGGAGSVDLWEWDGAQWTSLGTTPVQVQGGNVGPLPALAYEAASQRSILHSGCETWLLTSPYPASVVPFGQGCAGLRGIPALTHSGPGPWLGSTFSLDVVSGNGTTPLLCVLGTNPTMWASQPLPMGLSGFGMSGCLLYTDVLDLRVLSGSRYTLAIPNAAGLAGFGFYNQALVQDPGSNTANWVMTNATRSVIGRR